MQHVFLHSRSIVSLLIIFVNVSCVDSHVCRVCVSFVAMVVVSLSYVCPYLFAFLFVLVVQWMQSPGKMTNAVTVDNVFPGTVTDTVEELWRPKKELWSLGGGSSRRPCVHKCVSRSHTGCLKQSRL